MIFVRASRRARAHTREMSVLKKIKAIKPRNRNPNALRAFKSLHDQLRGKRKAGRRTTHYAAGAYNPQRVLDDLLSRM